ncbi:MAG: hypothetical protein IJY74_07305, partial [Oscillospiraceae bacterium]|nr:hypothetical protein [Oscillospiraceae bacterium]
MKKMIKTALSTILAVAILMSISAFAFAADSSVTYEGGAEKFVFLPGSEYTDSDLFDSFKGVMPGDVLTEEIVVKNDSGKTDYVNIYMRAIAHDEDVNPLSENVANSGETVATMSDFLSQLSMTVKNGTKVIFEGKASELDGLKENVLLGAFDKGESTTLTVELTVPAELGNEYAFRVGEVDWVFSVEELDYPEEP